jgi:hypothetical protein
VDSEFRSTVEKNKFDYTMTAWITASINNNILPALKDAAKDIDTANGEALFVAEEASGAEAQTA